jgi:hypothetical protein
MGDKAKDAAVWDHFLGLLTKSTRAALTREAPKALATPPLLQPSDEETDDYSILRASLTAATRDTLDAMVTNIENEEVQPNEDSGRYCLVEHPDGEWSNVRLFKTLEGLARRIGSLEGQDMQLWAFYAIPLVFTKGKQRYLMAPDGASAIQIPIYEGAPIKTIASDLLDGTPTQEDGFVGPVELAETRMMELKKAKSNATPPKPNKKERKHDDDDDDEEDEEDETSV